MKRLHIHVGTAFSKEDEINRLLDLGHAIIILDDAGLAEAVAMRAAQLDVSGLSAFEAARKLEEYLKQEEAEAISFFTLAELSVPLLNEFCGIYGRDPVSYLEGGTLRDKYLTRKRLEELGRKLETLALVESEQAIVVFPKSSFPLIVKPVNSVDSRNVFKVDSQQQLVSACEMILKGNNSVFNINGKSVHVEKVYGCRNQALIESFIAGDEYSAEVIVHKGHPYLQMVTRKDNGGPPYFCEVGHTVGPNPLNSVGSASLYALIDDVVRANRYCTTMLHVEFIIGQNQMAHLVEVNSRAAGGQIIKAIYLASGVDLVHRYLCLIGGEAPSLEGYVSVDRQFSIYYFTTYHEGRLKVLKKMYADNLIDWFYPDGAPVRHLQTKKTSRVGRVFFPSASLAEARDSFSELARNQESYFVCDQSSDGKITDYIKRGSKKIIFSLFSLSLLIMSIFAVMQSWHEHRTAIDLIGKTLSYGLRHNMAANEVTPIAEIVNSIDVGKWCRRIVVTDQHMRLLHERDYADQDSIEYLKAIDPKVFPYHFPVSVDGMEIGHVFVEDNPYNVVWMTLGYVVMTGLLLGLFAHLLFTRLEKILARADRGIAKISEKTVQVAQLLTAINMTDSVALEENIKRFALNIEDPSTEFAEIGALQTNWTILVSCLYDYSRRLRKTFHLELALEEKRKKHELEAKQSEAIRLITSQVAHDIRSPLAALEVAAGDVSQIPEDKRILIRSAVGRIRDVANSLLIKQHIQSIRAAPEVSVPQLLSSLIDPIISEKRLQFRAQSNVEIELWLDVSSCGLFAALQPGEFKRLLSNLINNSVESFSGGPGLVKVSLAARGGHALVSVQDNGKGIPPELLAKIGHRGETHGKTDGSGLGLYHARTCAESWGGRLELTSVVGTDTTATVILPLAPEPEWFVPELRLSPGKAVVILDDDASIHQVWQGRLDVLKVEERDVEVVHVSSPEEMRAWLKGNAAKAGQELYLFVYELLGFRETGLSLAEEFGLGERVILVTSRYEEPEVLGACRRLKVRLIPKGLAGSVPIRIESTLERWDAVLIDDDALTRMTWKMAADRAGKKLRVFSTAADFMKVSDTIDRATPVYIDAELADGVKGDAESIRIKELGFGEIYLATGHPAEKFAGLAHLRGVIGKEPPWGRIA